MRIRQLDTSGTLKLSRLPCSIYQLCLAHRDYPAVQSEGAKHPLWQSMNEFKSVSVPSSDANQQAELTCVDPPAPE